MLCLIVGAAWLSLQNTASAEKWTDLNGTSTIEADLVGLFGEKLVLQLADGRRITVPMNKLRAESRLRAKEISRQRAEQREARVSELFGAAEAASAAAPDPLPTPPQPPAYMPPPAEMNAVETLEYLDNQLTQGGHLLAVFDTLPPSRQSQLEQLAGQASLKVDPAAWNAVTGAVYELADLVVSHQNWIFSHPRFSVVPESDLERLETATLGLAGFLKAAFDPELMKLEELQTAPIRDWLARWDQATSPYLAKLLSSLEMDSPRYTVKKESDQEVVVEMSQGGVTSTQKLKKVEGVWTLASVAEFDAERLEEVQTKLDEVPDGSLGEGSGVSAMVGMMRGQLEPFKSASNASEFHAAMDAVIAQAQPAISAMAASAMGGNRGTRQGGDGYGEGYGEEYGDDYGEEYGEDYGSDYGN